MQDEQKVFLFFNQKANVKVKNINHLCGRPEKLDFIMRLVVGIELVIFENSVFLSANKLGNYSIFYLYSEELCALCSYS